STITFHCASDQGAKLLVNNKTLVEWSGPKDERSGSVDLVKGKSYPIRLIYDHKEGIGGYVTVTWGWQGHDKSPIGAEYLLHSPAQQRLVERYCLLSSD
ncbi:unnamed protein product, partial [marine sediment metagenome]